MNQDRNALSPRRGSRLLRAGFGLLLFAAGLWSGGCSNRAPRAGLGPAVPVTATRAKRGDVDLVVTALGTVTPVATVTVASRVVGVLTEVDYREGQTVKRNDLLAVIDPRPYQAALIQAQGQLARDQALLDNARIDLARYRAAYDNHAIPEQQVATAEASVREDEGVVRLDQGNLDAAQVNLDYTRIVSPIDGRVGLRLVDPGNIVPANGSSGLLTITQLRPITVIFPLAQNYLPRVNRAIRSGRTLRVEALDDPGRPPVAEGELLTVDNEVDPTTGTVRLKAVFPNEDEALWPGEFVTVRLSTGSVRDGVTVPARAVQSGPDGSYLYVVKPDLTVEMRNVQVGQVDRGTALIDRGLSAGERVVVDGQYRLEPGVKVAIAADASASP